MVPKFANPHSLSQDVEKTTRSEFAERTGFTSIIHEKDNRSLKHDLDILLRDTWADALAEASEAKKLRDIGDDHKNEDERLTFRLLSSMKHPQLISLYPKPPPRPVTREPECEDDEMQAETRRMRALSVAMDGESLRAAAVAAAAVSKRRIDLKPVGSKVLLTDISLAALPPLLATEEVRARRTAQRVKNGESQAHGGFAVSPHEPRLSCTVLPARSIPNRREMSGKKRRKPVRERPPPAYWRPPSELRGKCMGYALGYPSNWAPDLPYVRDAMTRGVESTAGCD